MGKDTCAFAGHNPSRFPWGRDESSKDCVAQKEILASEIMRLADTGVTHFLSGMSEGVDTWAAAIVLALREKNPMLKLHCILPCRSQADDWSESAKDLYRSILEQADSVVYVSRDYHNNCMIEQNKFMVDHASILLAVSQGLQHSGTTATINYARQIGREIIIIDPVHHQLTYENPSSDFTSI